MKITVSGKIKEINTGENLEKLVSSLFEKNEGIIVELNEEMINRNLWKKQLLQEGDMIEFVQFVGGG